MSVKVLFVGGDSAQVPFRYIKQDTRPGSNYAVGRTQLSNWQKAKLKTISPQSHAERLANEPGAGGLL